MFVFNRLIEYMVHFVPYISLKMLPMVLYISEINSILD